jgi:hypothetical protein
MSDQQCGWVCRGGKSSDMMLKIQSGSSLMKYTLTGTFCTELIRIFTYMVPVHIND